MAGLWRGRWQAAALALSVAVLLPLATFLVAVWLLGWQLQHVESGSMSPTFPVGSLLVTAQVDPTDVTVGMPIVFEDPREPGRLVTHRVVGVAPGADLSFLTRGDANATNDPVPVPARLVRGRVLWHVTALGTVLDWFQWPRSFLILVLLPAVLLALAEWRSRQSGRRGKTTSVDLPTAVSSKEAEMRA
jgi:signal peptidase I